MILMYRNQILAALAATIGAFGLGTVLGYTSPAMPNMRNKIKAGELNFDISDEEVSWIASVVNLGALVSVIVVGLLVDVIGRKMLMLLLSVPFALGWLLVVSSNGAIMLIVGRAVTGFCGGGFSLAAPLFVAEISDDSIRGALGSGFQVMVVSGILFTYVFGYFLTWQWLAILSGIVPLVFLVAMFFIPESPRYLVSKGKVDDAYRSLCWFRNKTSTLDVEEEMRLIEMSVDQVKAQTSNIRDLLEPHNFQPLLLMVAIMLFQQLSGVNAVIFNTTYIFVTAGSTLDSGVATILVGIVQLLAACSSIFLADRAGRKFLLLCSSFGMCGSLVVLGIFFQLKSIGEHQHLGVLPVICLMIFIAAFNIGYGPIPWVMLGELIPQKVKARVGTVSMVINWALAFLVTKFFKSIQDAVTIQWCFFIFAIVCAVGFVFVFFLLPETKGKSFEEIQRYFGGPSSTSDETSNKPKK